MTTTTTTTTAITMHMHTCARASGSVHLRLFFVASRQLLLLSHKCGICVRGIVARVTIHSY